MLLLCQHFVSSFRLLALEVTNCRIYLVLTEHNEYINIFECAKGIKHVNSFLQYCISVKHLEKLELRFKGSINPFGFLLVGRHVVSADSKLLLDSCFYKGLVKAPYSFCSLIIAKFSQFFCQICYKIIIVLHYFAI